MDKDVDIYRKWPNRITMLITQHQPIARYGMQGLINEDSEFLEQPMRITYQ